MFGFKKKPKIPEPKFNVGDFVVYYNPGISPPEPPKSFFVIEREFEREVYGTLSPVLDKKWLYTGYILKPLKTDNPHYKELTVIEGMKMIKEEDLFPLPYIGPIKTLEESLDEQFKFCIG